MVIDCGVSGSRGCFDRGLFGSKGRGGVEVDEGLGCLGAVLVLNLCPSPFDSHKGYCIT